MSRDKQVQQGSHSEDFGLQTPAAGAVSPPASSYTPAFCLLKLPLQGPSTTLDRDSVPLCVEGDRRRGFPFCSVLLGGLPPVTYLS